MKTSLLTVAALALLTTLGFTAVPAKLNIGDPAPPLTVAKWFKGEPVPKIEPGQVYVVEFWATWCGPCRTSIPHLTELAKQHAGKVKFVGMSVWEREKDNEKRFAKIEAFVKEMGEKMEYSVGAEEGETMAQAWMTAAGERGIPSAFVVGKDGKIAWIGHPMSDLGKVLPAVLDGTYDSKTASEARAKEKAAAARQQELMAPIMEFQRAGKFKEAVEAIDKAIAENPEMAERFSTMRFSMLLRYDEAAAYAHARKVAASAGKDSARTLSTLARQIIGARAQGKPDYDLALELALKADELSGGQDAMTQSAIADVYFGKGDVAKATEHGQRAVELASKPEGGSEPMAKYLKGRLETYKAPAKPAAEPASKPAATIQ